MARSKRRQRENFDGEPLKKEEAAAAAACEVSGAGSYSPAGREGATSVRNNGAVLRSVPAHRGGAAN